MVRTCDLWHGHPCHLSKQVLSLLAQSLDFNLVKKANELCDVYFHSTSHLSQSEIKASTVFEVVYHNVLEAYRIPSSCGAHYALIILDDASRLAWI